MSLTTGDGCKRAIGLFKLKAENGEMTAGEPEYFIPGAESFLSFEKGADVDESTISYLTTKRMADLMDDHTDAREARLVSPSQVKTISFKQIKELNLLMK